MSYGQWLWVGRYWVVPKPWAMKSLIACRESVVESGLSRQTRLRPPSPQQPADETKIPSVSAAPAAMAFARDKLVTRSLRSVAVVDIGKITFNEKCHVHPSQNRDVEGGDSCTRSFPIGYNQMLRRTLQGMEKDRVPCVARTVHAVPRGGYGQERGQPEATLSSAYIERD